MLRCDFCVRQTSCRFQLLSAARFSHNSPRRHNFLSIYNASCLRQLKLKRTGGWSISATVRERSATNSSTTATGDRARKPKRFFSVEAAVAYYRRKEDWSIQDLTGDCLEKRAWLALAKHFDNAEDEELHLLYPLTCFLISLGLSQSQVVSHVAKRYNGPSFPPMRVRTLATKIAFLQERFGFSRAELARIVVTHNRILDYSVKRTLEPRTVFFEEYFQMKGPALGKIILRTPTLLCADLEDDVLAKVNLLCGVVVDPQAVASMLARQPGILCCSELSIQDKVRQLVQELQLDRTQLPRVLSRAPSLLQRDLRCITEIAAVLTDFGVSREQLGDLCTRFPNVLTLSPSSLRAKLRFCTEGMGLDIQTVLTNPALLGMSLEGRLMPRHKAMKAVQGDRRLLVRAYFVSEENFQEHLQVMSSRGGSR